MNTIETRFLMSNDIPLLLDLEKKQWSEDQLPSKDTLQQRIQIHPELSMGSFCTKTGKALASMFFKPTQKSLYTETTITWSQCAKITEPEETFKTDSLFGISFTSINDKASADLFAFCFPYLVSIGYKDFYLGSPMPGYGKAKLKTPSLCPTEYAHKKNPQRPVEPYDPQLNYYYKKGIKSIISVQENYFPHERSLNYGVIIGGELASVKYSSTQQHN